MHEKLRGVHPNRMKAGLVLRAVDWPESSARWSEERKSARVSIG